MYPSSDRSADEQQAYHVFNTKVNDLLDRLKNTTVTPSSHAEVLFQFNGQLKLELYASAAEIEKDLRETIGIRSNANASIFLLRLYTATANFFKSFRGFQTLRQPSQLQTEFAKGLIEAYVFLSQKTAASTQSTDEALHTLNNKLILAYNDIGNGEVLTGKIEEECSQLKNAIAQYKAQLEGLQSQIKSLQVQTTENQSTRTALVKLETEHSVLKRDHEFLKKQHAHALVAIGKAQTEIKMLRKQLANQCSAPPNDNQTVVSKQKSYTAAESQQQVSDRSQASDKSQVLNESKHDASTRSNSGKSGSSLNDSSKTATSVNSPSNDWNLPLEETKTQEQKPNHPDFLQKKQKLDATYNSMSQTIIKEHIANIAASEDSIHLPHIGFSTILDDVSLMFDNN